MGGINGISVSGEDSTAPKVVLPAGPHYDQVCRLTVLQRLGPESPSLCHRTKMYFLCYRTADSQPWGNLCRTLGTKERVLGVPDSSTHPTCPLISEQFCPMSLVLSAV